MLTLGVGLGIGRLLGLAKSSSAITIRVSSLPIALFLGISSAGHGAVSGDWGSSDHWASMSLVVWVDPLLPVRGQ